MMLSEQHQLGMDSGGGLRRRSAAPSGSSAPAFDTSAAYIPPREPFAWTSSSQNMALPALNQRLLNHLRTFLPKTKTLQEQLNSVVARVQQGAGPDGYSEDYYKLLKFALQDLHACILGLDDDLHCVHGDESIVGECRRWLQDLQLYVMALQRDVEAVWQAEAEVQPLLRADSAASGQQHARQWQSLLSGAAEKLRCMADLSSASSPAALAAHADAHAHSDGAGDSSSCSSSTCGSSLTSSMGSSRASSGRKLVAMGSRLSYNLHWKGKIAI